MSTAKVKIWEQTAGYVTWEPGMNAAVFEYEDEFIKSGIELSPLMMPLKTSEKTFLFAGLEKAFNGLPGLLADSLPDKFGNSIIGEWIKRNKKKPDQFNSVDRLCYIGKRGMGALEYEPAITEGMDESVKVDIEELSKLAGDILNEREMFNSNLNKENVLLDIMRVSASPGGARPKAVIAINDKTGEIRSGQVDVPAGFSHWIIKFDVDENKTTGDPLHFGKIEYAYYKMVTDCGIKMNECRIHHEKGRSHFLTKRFDRIGNKKIHMHSLFGMAHLDFNQRHSYESAFTVLRKLNAGHEHTEELYRRMIFNVVGRNQDDHTKNISFLMDDKGKWSLSPAYDMVYSVGLFWARHEMSINGKTDNFTMNDLEDIGKEHSIKNYSAIIEKTIGIVSNWKHYAKEADVPLNISQSIGKAHRLSFPQERKRGLNPGQIR